MTNEQHAIADFESYLRELDKGCTPERMEEMRLDAVVTIALAGSLSMPPSLHRSIYRVLCETQK